MISLTVFGREYSKYYDLLYEDKKYEEECDYLEHLFERFSPHKVVSIRDVACGTGRHAIPLAERGYYVHASDISSYMVEVARARLRRAAKAERVHLATGDMRHIAGGKKFDVALCMFASLGYLSRTGDILDALGSIRRSLKPGGLLIFDIWNGIAVLTVKPSTRTKTIRKSSRTITRKATPTLDSINNLCKVEYNISITDEEGNKEKFQETHVMRYFFPQELRDLLTFGAYELLSLHPFLEVRRKITKRDWNITVVATPRVEDA
jgi:SAM-dependent methyltransferase